MTPNPARSPLRRSVLAAMLSLAACSASQSSGQDGASSSGGVPGSGGTGGSASSGGTGVPSSGGSTGSPGSGGANGTGGVIATGGAGSGGANASGGSGDTSGGVGGKGGFGDATGGIGGRGTGGVISTGGAAGGGGRTGAGGAAGGSTGRMTCPSGPFPTPMVVSTKNVCANFSFAYTWNEGPTWVAGQGAFFFTNFVAGSASGGNIIKYTPGGDCEVFIRDVGCNGLAVSNDGNLLAACQQSRAIVKFDVKTKQMTVVADKLGNAMLDTPNDLVQHSNGTIYFSNPLNELAGRPTGAGQSALRIDPTGTVIKIADGNFNGIALSPDEKTLYVVRTDVWTLDAQGVPSNKRAMVSNNGDGMAVDCAGNLYVEGKIFSSTNQQLGTYGAGTNLSFGGADGKTVLVVGSGKAVRELAMNVPGLP